MTGPHRPLQRPDLFIDTSGFYASTNRSDVNSAAARAVLSRAARERRPLLTTTYVIAETHALFLSRLGREAGVGFLRTLERSAIQIVRPLEIDEEAAKAIIYRYRDKSFSLTDAISFAVMERLGIATPFTFASDFRQYGFTPATP